MKRVFLAFEVHITASCHQKEQSVVKSTETGQTFGKMATTSTDISDIGRKEQRMTETTNLFAMIGTLCKHRIQLRVESLYLTGDDGEGLYYLFCAGKGPPPPLQAELC